MKKQKKYYQKKPFESTGLSSDTSANIYKSMLMSPAWRNLTSQQHNLYLCCKAQYYGEKHKPIFGDNTTFTMSRSKWSNKYDTGYGLYDERNGKGFYRDMNALIEHGFISCVECGANTRTKSIYRFSSMWQQYGTPFFHVPPTEWTLALKRKMDRQKNE